MNQEERRRKQLHQMVHQAVYNFAVDYLSEHGGSVRDGIHAARMALQQAEVKEVENSQWQNRMLTQRVAQALDRQQDKVRERILTAERLWIRSGVTTRWHRVATPTRAYCGAAINDDGKAWALSSDQPFPEDTCLRCKG